MLYDHMIKGKILRLFLCFSFKKNKDIDFITFSLFLLFAFQYRIQYCTPYPKHLIHHDTLHPVQQTIFNNSIMFVGECNVTYLNHILDLQSVQIHWCCGFNSRPGWGVPHYTIKFVSDLRQVGGFLRVIRFSSQIKLTTSI